MSNKKIILKHSTDKSSPTLEYGELAINTVSRTGEVCILAKNGSETITTSLFDNGEKQRFQKSCKVFNGDKTECDCKVKLIRTTSDSTVTLYEGDFVNGCENVIILENSSTANDATYEIVGNDDDGLTINGNTSFKVFANSFIILVLYLNGSEIFIEKL